MAYTSHPLCIYINSKETDKKSVKNEEKLLKIKVFFYGLVGGRRFALFFCFEKHLARSDAAVELRSLSELRVLFVKSVHCFLPTALILNKKQRSFFP